MLPPVLIKDPSAELDYGFDWSARSWLDAGETISAAVWTIPAGLTLITSQIVGSKTVAWIGGGTAGTDYTIACRITTSAGRTDERSMTLRVRER